MESVVPKVNLNPREQRGWKTALDLQQPLVQILRTGKGGVTFPKDTANLAESVLARKDRPRHAKPNAGFVYEAHSAGWPQWRSEQAVQRSQLGDPLHSTHPLDP